MTAPLVLTGPRELSAGGTLKVIDNDTGEQKSAAGLWHLRSDRNGIDVVLTLSSERYVAAVLNAETAGDEAPESLRAMAIVARTYALNGPHYSAQPAHLPADLCDSTGCQAMRLGEVSAAIDDAVRDTAGETVWFQGRRAEVFFSEHCGGMTEDASTVWPRLHGATYLRRHPDPYCLRRGTAAWHTEVSSAEFSSIASAQGWQLPEPLVAAKVVQRSGSSRALQAEFSDAHSHSTWLMASALRLGIDRTLGWNRIRSDQYELALRGGILVFDGHGYGHGVGLCQTGAAEMASEHKSTKEILGFYFPGTAVRIGLDDQGWRITHTPSFTVRSTQIESAAQLEELEGIWREAMQRFSPHGKLSPEITIAPSTELFRQLTSLPGWVLASTQGTRLVLQPASVLNKGGSIRKVMLHEMLHLLVESEATYHAPLWFREGMVEELSDEALSSASSMPHEAIDNALRSAASWSESERAHRAAGARVHMLAERYGMSTLRGWLRSGLPSGVA
ncbi:SpoIID/LytB domain-containing protein [Acidisarcina polymorpha]|uniref:SpoIID/LytB domain-containing protein n=1 Tax=Acidisarcina polymorpha TaxID=2211140 RepID=UPI0013753570|nr:SpoIID/LytB domain-containing protein [Acidisarcina polymorpha]